MVAWGVGGRGGCYKRHEAAFGGGDMFAFLIAVMASQVCMYIKTSNYVSKMHSYYRSIVP